MNKRELEEKLKKTSAGRKFLEEAEPEKQTDNLIEFAKDQCEIFPEDSYMGKYLRETIKILQAEPCEDAVSREDVVERSKIDKAILAMGREKNSEFWTSTFRDGIDYALELLKKNLGIEESEDAISREDVIKAVDRHTFDTDDGLCLDEDISIILEELPPVKPTQNWIPVAEDVPPIGVICLWCNKQGSVFTSEITYRSECNSYVGKHGYFSNSLENYGDIVAWMPLPKPYKGSEEA